MSEQVAPQLRGDASSWTPGKEPSAWRGTIATVVDRGTHISGDRVWRCFHKHRTEDAALRCAKRELRRKARDE